MNMIALLASLAQVTGAAPSADHRILYSNDPQKRAMQQQIGWADAVIAGDTVHVSGVIAYVRPGEQGLEPAYTRAFEELTDILRRAGLTWADVVEIRSFHTDPAAQIEAIATVKRRFRAAPDPAWTAVGTSALLDRRGITEIALTAHKPRNPTR